METYDKLRLLARDSQYDLACSCGTSEQDRRTRSAEGTWLYPVPLAAGGTGIMFKTLLSNACSSDCAYCPLRHTGNTQRCSLLPEEVATAFTEHLRRQKLIGIFLSSGITGSADQTMERLVAAGELLRRKYSYRGYIHLKVIPGASEAAIDAALRVASAVSLNIEVPGRKHFEKLSQYKHFDEDIVRPLKYIAAQTAKGMRYATRRTTTQFIVGASDETDREIVTYLDGIYTRLAFDRAYFSAYQAQAGESRTAGGAPAERLMREHRLYQADFLLRRYRFAAAELVYDEQGNFSIDCDPKEMWAQRHPEFFPVRIQTAEREALLRVPGLGPVSVARILAARRLGRLATLAQAGLRGQACAKAMAYCSFA